LAGCLCRARSGGGGSLRGDTDGSCPYPGGIWDASRRRAPCAASLSWREGVRAFEQAVRVRIQTYRRGLEALCAAGPGLLFVGVEWNDELPTHQRLSSHRLSALRHLIPTVESYCDARDERCLVVADEEETTTDEAVAVVREHQRSCADEGALSRILDTPLFTQSHHSYGVPACDLAAFLRTRRALARPDEDARAKRTLTGLWSMGEPHVVEDACHSAPSAADVLLATGATTKAR
jgi:hypothetical protein